MQRVHSISGIAAAAALACAAPFALAQVAPASSPPPQHPKSGAVSQAPPFQLAPTQNPASQQLPARIPKANPASGIMGQHDMAGTVDSVDKNGFVDVKTGLGELKVHFPGASQHLKKGDRIILHLSYSMDESASQSPATSPSS
jgi:hypothetical protein